MTLQDLERSSYSKIMSPDRSVREKLLQSIQGLNSSNQAAKNIMIEDFQGRSALVESDANLVSQPANVIPAFNVSSGPEKSDADSRLRYGKCDQKEDSILDVV